MYKSYFEKKLENLDRSYDAETGMLLRNMGRSPGYHTRLEGNIHPILETAYYAELVYYLRAEALYPRAAHCLWSLCKLQDRREESKTQGLWSYYAEEGVDDMIAPDYNWADFVGRHIAFVLKKRADCIDAALKSALTDALVLAAKCSIRRNVGADYTNIAMMSSVTIVAAAEVTEDAEMLAFGRSRLAHFLEYNEWCGAFSEYNSPNYSPLAIEEISRMTMLFEDEECLRTAEALNDIAWRMVASHFVSNNGQYMPPYMRAYQDVTPKSTLSMIYIATNGKYGALQESDIGMTRLPYHCPQKYFHYFEPIACEREISEIYYRKNNIRYPQEDVTIVRNFDSPDLAAYSYATPAFSMGAFRVCDTWTQRRNAMVIFGDVEAPTTLRLQCLKSNAAEKDYPVYDTCMGFVTADMKKNVMLGQCGFTVDHGDFHYILDKVKDGRYAMEALRFCFTLGGNTEGVSVQRTARGCRFSKNGTCVEVALYACVFDGKPMEFYWNEDEKRLALVCLDGARQTVDLPALKECVFTFTLSVNSECAAPVIEETGGVRYAALGDLSVASYTKPVAYDTAVELSAVKAK